MMHNHDPPAFIVKDCALSAIATGQSVQNLRALREKLAVIHPESIYYHFWGGLLRPHFDDPEYNNDFASWVRHALNDAPLAERLGVIDPAEHTNLETLRQELLDVLDERLEESEYPAWAPQDNQFHFVRSQIVIFDTGRRLSDPSALAEALGSLSLGSIFYHLIDARRRDPQGVDDFRPWLARFGEEYAPLMARLSDIDPYFIDLSELRLRLVQAFQECLGRRS